MLIAVLIGFLVTVRMIVWAYELRERHRERKEFRQQFLYRQ